ncbi:hypothetical protein QTI51_37285 [Variovorax sp. J22G73]|uniref:hypothetical protein n=1 Tax=unclassified Variovorax TaxID=663243 RepID=UPI002574CC3F|nr:MULTISPECIES: hypothetical protein [unclassified Variovorax]MDM0010158.1 hypothetical protein [Variovorax sp. J22R203]MDM0102980.1 hypothetical protein [Variovorax sp. J22G73]
MPIETSASPWPNPAALHFETNIRIDMQTPELLLNKLNAALLDLHAGSAVLSDPKLSLALKQALSQLIVAETMSKNWIIAVAGSQGAGKTTLVQALYGLASGPDSWLKPNEGRGEKMPVLVVEDPACKIPQGTLRVLDRVGDRTALATRDVKPAEFHAAVCGELPEVVLPVLLVPLRHFHREGQAMLLLPGYEVIDRDNNAWQNLMRLALVGAAGCIVVTDETRMAGEQESAILRDMLATQLNGMRPLVAISKTEGLASQPESVQRLKQRAADVFDIPSDRLDASVHCIGVADPDYALQWLPRLSAALRDISLGGSAARKTQLTRLESVVSDDLGRVLDLARVRAQLHYAVDEDVGGATEVVKRFLEAFDGSRDELREEVRKAVSKLSQKHFDCARNELDRILPERHEGLMNKFKGVLDTVSESQQQLESSVKDAWAMSGPVLKRFAEETEGISKLAMGVPKSSAETPARIGSHTLAIDQSRQPAPAETRATERPDAVRPNADDIANLQILFHDRYPVEQAGNEKSITKTNKTLERTIQLLPALTLEFLRTATLHPSLVGVDPKTLQPLPAADLAASLEKVGQQFNQATELSKSIMRGVAVVMAVDVGVDGELNSVPALINVLTGSGGAAAAAGTVASAVVGVVAVAYLAHSALQEVRRHDGQVRSIAHGMLHSIADGHQIHFMERVDEVLDRVRERLAQQLRRRYHLDEKLMTQDRLAKALSDVESHRRELLEEIARSGASVNWFSETPA